jgi:DNA repair ATPase RecN
MNRVEKIWAELSAKPQEELQLKEWQQEILEKETLNLSSVSELSKYLSKVDTAIKSATSALSLIDDAEQEFEKAKDKLDNSYKEFQDVRSDTAQVAFEGYDALMEFDNKVKELGLSSSEVPEYAELDKSLRKLRDLNDKLDSKRP